MKPLLSGLLIMTLCFAASGRTISPDHQFIEYTGRIDFTDSTAPAFSYSGVSIRACFTGTNISAVLDDNIGGNIYNLLLDGKLVDTLHVARGLKTYVLAKGLENRAHEIELFKRTEEMFGKTRFCGFIVDEGSSLIPIQNKRSRLIEYIGDSITCGYGNEGGLDQTFGPDTENHFMTYAAITSRQFNARHLAVCKSGIGIYRNYDGPVEGSPDNMAQFYPRIFLWDPKPEYDFAETPDLVCINLGTNDFSTQGGDPICFRDNYLRLIDTLQTRYDNPDIVCLLGPMLSDEALATVRHLLQNIVADANKEGQGRVSFFEMSPQTGDRGMGTDYHPTVAQHQKNALELTGFIAKLKGWEISR
ncbi:MAG: hypothetical protein JXQ65_13115 [Candidatus Marinimicrobia bacterium]|nr:hypothetical protein [Candidatus Neomarinimicrobiota bacterium]